jgi:hypothetical protein
MITPVFIHIGQRLPHHFWDAVANLRRFFLGNICLIIPENELVCPDIPRYRCTAVSWESLAEGPKSKRLEKVSCLRSYGKEGFWHVTLQRLFILETFMESRKLSHVLHIENDVLTFCDPAGLEQAFCECYPHMAAVNPIGPSHAAAAFMYIDEVAAIEFINRSMLELLEGDADALRKKHNLDMINEMVILAILQRQYPERIGALPLMPVEGFDGNSDRFGMFFDGASWGQYAGGTPHGLTAGAAFEHHWVGRELLQKRFTLSWNKDEAGRSCPFIRSTDNSNKTGKLANLHIHSKKLVNFMDVGEQKPGLYPLLRSYCNRFEARKVLLIGADSGDTKFITSFGIETVDCGIPITDDCLDINARLPVFDKIISAGFDWVFIDGKNLPDKDAAHIIDRLATKVPCIFLINADMPGQQWKSLRLNTGWRWIDIRESDKWLSLLTDKSNVMEWADAFAISRYEKNLKRRTYPNQPIRNVLRRLGI